MGSRDTRTIEVVRVGETLDELELSLKPQSLRIFLHLSTGSCRDKIHIRLSLVVVTTTVYTHQQSQHLQPSRLSGYKGQCEEVKVHGLVSCYHVGGVAELPSRSSPRPEPRPRCERDQDPAKPRGTPGNIREGRRHWRKEPIQGPLLACQWNCSYRG